jgi:hypothetical protein
MGCVGVGSITIATQIILDNNRCTILLVLVMPVIQSTHFSYSDTSELYRPSDSRLSAKLAQLLDIEGGMWSA